jgi:hypothetical protein
MHVEDPGRPTSRRLKKARTSSAALVYMIACVPVIIRFSIAADLDSLERPTRYRIAPALAGYLGVRHHLRDEVGGNRHSGYHVAAQPAALVVAQVPRPRQQSLRPARTRGTASWSAHDERSGAARSRCMPWSGRQWE